MKKVFALLAAILATGPVLNAQDDDPSFRFGIKLSPNLATVRSETKGLKSSGSVVGFSFGLMAEFPLGNSGNYRFATGLNLNNIGGAWERDLTYRRSDSTASEMTKLETSKAKLQYIELPITLKLMTNEIGYMRYFGIVGLSAAFNIRAKADQDMPTPTSLQGTAPIVSSFTKEENVDISDDINLFKAALVGGLGAEYNLSGNTSLLLGFTYNGGFINILGFDMPNDGGKAKAMLNYFELSLGVFF